MKTQEEKLRKAEYDKQYRISHPEKTREINKRWRDAHPEQVRVIKQKDYQDRKEYIKARRREYYYHNHDFVKKQANAHYHANKDSIRKIRNETLEKILRSWIGIVPEFTSCQMCGIDLVFFGKDGYKSIHFDHRHGGNEAIKIDPKHWLKRNLPTPENIIIWKSCDFGMLCRPCNRRLPTKDRMKFFLNLKNYMGIS